MLGTLQENTQAVFNFKEYKMPLEKQDHQHGLILARGLAGFWKRQKMTLLKLCLKLNGIRLKVF